MSKFRDFLDMFECWPTKKGDVGAELRTNICKDN